MKSYYERDGIIIYHANCADLFNDIPWADLIITDPPYGMEWISGHRIVKYDGIKGDETMPVKLITRAIGMCLNAAYIFCRWDNLGQLPKPTSFCVWVKNNQNGSGDLYHEHARQWEAIAFYAHGKHKFTKRPSDVFYADRTGNDLHPSQKPVSLIKQLIECNVGNLVIDPFMGSGTTLIAAKECGRKAIGIEIEEKHCETAAKRLESCQVFNFEQVKQEQNTGKLF